MTNEDPKKLYIEAWNRILGDFKGWNKEKIQAWALATNKLQRLSDEDSMLYHESPLYWSVDALIPHELYSTLTIMDRINLRARILDFLCRIDPDGFSENIDWKSHKGALSALLQPSQTPDRYVIETPRCWPRGKPKPSPVEITRKPEDRQVSHSPGRPIYFRRPISA